MLAKISFLNSKGDVVNIQNTKKNTALLGNNGNSEYKGDKLDNTNKENMLNNVIEKYNSETNRNKKRYLKQILGNLHVIKDIYIDIEKSIDTNYTSLKLENEFCKGNIVFVTIENTNEINVKFDIQIATEENEYQLIECNENIELYVNTFGQINQGLLYCINESKIILTSEVYNKLINLTDENILNNLKNNCQEYLFIFLKSVFLTYNSKEMVLNNYKKYELGTENNTVNEELLKFVFELIIVYIESVLSEYPKNIVQLFMNALNSIFDGIKISNQTLYSLKTIPATLIKNGNNMTIRSEFKENTLYHLKDLTIRLN